VIHYASRIALSLLLALQAGTVMVAQAGAPNSCGIVTPAAWAAALSRPVTGGKISVANDPAATASSCLYQSGAMFITVQVDQLPTAAAAQKEYSEQLANSRGRDQQHSQSTTLETGIGDAAFSSAFTDGTEVEFTAVRGSRLLTFGLVGPGAAAVPHDQLRGLMQTALDH
jgi:hypothetical protein